MSDYGLDNFKAALPSTVSDCIVGSSLGTEQQQLSGNDETASKLLEPLFRMGKDSRETVPNVTMTVRQNL